MDYLWAWGLTTEEEHEDKQRTRQFTQVALKFHLTSDYNACAQCWQISRYPQDFEHFQQHCEALQIFIHQYLTIDPTHIVMAYLPRGFVCHYCNAYNRLSEYLSYGLSEKSSKRQRRIVPSFEEFYTADYIKTTKNNNKYIVINFSHKTIRYKTFLNDRDIYELLFDLGIIMKGVVDIRSNSPFFQKYRPQFNR